jgi:DNA-binding response OmpR family regulator
VSILKDFKTIFANKKDSDTPIENIQTSSQKKILIIEDETLLANTLEKKFVHAGFAVIKAANGQLGLDMTEANNPDVILLDLMMPVMDGKTMLHKLRENPKFKKLPVIVLTNAGDVDNMRETKVYDNASAFLIKSNTSPDELLTVNDIIKLNTA